MAKQGRAKHAKPPLLATKPAHPLPPLSGDFYRSVDLLDEKGHATIARLRKFLESEVAPIIEEY